MRTMDRGITKPKPLTALSLFDKTKGVECDEDHKINDPRKHIQSQKEWRATNPHKWTPNNYMPNLLSFTRPLMDGTHTPRGARKAITLERTFDKNAWMYNRNTCEDFNPKAQITKDKHKSRVLRKIIRNRKKREMIKSRSPSP